MVFYPTTHQDYKKNLRIYFFMLKKPIFEKFKTIFRGVKGVLKAQKNFFLKSDEMFNFAAYEQSIFCSWVEEIK